MFTCTISQYLQTHENLGYHADLHHCNEMMETNRTQNELH